MSVYFYAYSDWWWWWGRGAGVGGTFGEIYYYEDDERIISINKILKLKNWWDPIFLNKINIFVRSSVFR